MVEKVSRGLTGAMLMALMVCVGWMVRPEPDHVSRREWREMESRQAAEMAGIHVAIAGVGAEVRGIRRDLGMLAERPILPPDFFSIAAETP